MKLFKYNLRHVLQKLKILFRKRASWTYYDFCIGSAPRVSKIANFVWWAYLTKLLWFPNTCPCNSKVHPLDKYYYTIGSLNEQNREHCDIKQLTPEYNSLYLGFSENIKNESRKQSKWFKNLEGVRKICKHYFIV